MIFVEGNNPKRMTLISYDDRPQVIGKMAALSFHTVRLDTPGKSGKNLTNGARNALFESWKGAKLLMLSDLLCVAA